MKIRDYLLSQKSLVRNQIEKNNKLIRELLLSKSPQSFKLRKEKEKVESLYNPKNISLKTFKAIQKKKEKDRIAEQIKEENKFFIQLYEKTKKLYPTKVEETFKDLIYQYRINDYKIPDLSDKKNLFNQNPLLLVGRDLDQYYIYSDKIKNNSKTKYRLNRKHINFIKKEMIFMEKMISKNNDIGNKNNKSKDNSYKDDDIDYKPEKINYLLVDSVWDKIKNQKKKQKYLLSYENRKTINKTNTVYKSSKNFKTDLLNDNNENLSSKKYIDSYNTFNYNSSKTCNKKLKLKIFNNNESNISNNKNNAILHNLHSIDNIQTVSSNYASPIKKIKSQLLNFTLNDNKENKENNKENNKLQKEIEEIKNTISNKNLIEKDIIFDNKYKVSKSIENNNMHSNKTNYLSKMSATLPSSFLKKKFPFLHSNSNKINSIPKNNIGQNFNRVVDTYNNKKTNYNTINIDKNYNKKNSSSKEKIKNKSYIFTKSNKLNKINILDLIRKRTIPYITMNKLLKEKDPHKFIDIISRVNLKIFNRKEIEKLMKYYCEKILGYNEKDIERIVNTQKNDENIYQIIEIIIQKTKKKPIGYFGKNKIRNLLEDVNNSIFALKKNLYLGKQILIIVKVSY
jgi:hypothetical protein